MINIKIICVGNLKEKYLKDAIAEYSKRLSTLCNFQIIELSEAFCPSESYIEKALEEEANMIIKSAGKSAVIPLCIEGKQYSSTQFNDLIQDKALAGQSSIAFVIGSSHGLSPKIKAMGKGLSVSKMTFPHQLFRLMLCEQIYRAFQINAGTKYHK
ncbi:MAG: 23S rRNA (pseudouridine(1915)-N(3))-methyltransferase RlmH [Clostridia bacterium]